jgi:hypothetical protein
VYPQQWENNGASDGTYCIKANKQFCREFFGPEHLGEAIGKIAMKNKKLKSSNLDQLEFGLNQKKSVS